VVLVAEPMLEVDLQGLLVEVGPLTLEAVVQEVLVLELVVLVAQVSSSLLIQPHKLCYNT